MRKFFALLLTIVVCTSATFAENSKCGDNLTWSLQDSVLTIDGQGDMWYYTPWSDPVTIPWDQQGFHTLIISPNVTSISEDAFMESTRLRTIYWNIQKYKSEYMNDQQKFPYLTHIIFGEEVETIPALICYRCENLKEITMPLSIKTIGEYAFSECTGLTSISLPNSLKRIEQGAFSGCIGLTVLTIPSSVTHIGHSAFSGCVNLTSLEIPNSVIEIGGEAFAYCNNFTSVTWNMKNCQNVWLDSKKPLQLTLGEDVESFAGYCAGLVSITSQTINPPTLDEYIFQDVDKSIPLYVPAGSIDAYQTANYWKNFNHIYAIGEEEPFYPIYIHVYDSVWQRELNWAVIYLDIDTALFEEYNYASGHHECLVDAHMLARNQGYLIAHTTPRYNARYWIKEEDYVPYDSLFLTVHDTTDVTLVVSKRKYRAHFEVNNYRQGHIRFYGNHNHTDTTFYAYYADTATIEAIPYEGYKFVRWSDGNTKPSRFLRFTQDYDLTAYFEPSSCLIASGTCGEHLTWELSCDSVLTISGTGEMTDYPVVQNSQIKQVVVNEGVTSIMSYAFDTCANLYTVYIPASVERIGEGAFMGCPKLTHIEVDKMNQNYASFDGVLHNKDWTTLIQYPAGRKDSLYSVSSKVERIGAYAFYNSKNLYSIKLPDRLEIIEDYAFNYCDHLSSIVIPNRVGKIGNGAFFYCTNLDSVSIGYNVCYIGNNVFYGCSKLSKIDMPSSVCEIGRAAFTRCSSLTTITLPDSLSTISDNLFDGCSSLTSIVIPNGHFNATIKTIGACAFRRCNSLSDVTIGNGVNTIYADAFYNCKNLRSITCNAINPPTLSMDKTGVFYGVDKSIPLYVPGESIEDYKSANGWKDFYNILPIPGTEPCQNYYFEETREICALDTFMWRDILVQHSYKTETTSLNWHGYVKTYREEDTTFVDKYKTTDGCDSVYMLHVHFRQSYYTYWIDSLNWWEPCDVCDQLSEVSPNTYEGYIYSTPANGCDSIVFMHIYVDPKPTYTITTAVNNSRYGVVVGAGTYPADTTITITAFPNKGYQFNEWSDGNKDNPRQITVKRDETYTAIFGNKMCSWLVESNDLEMGAVITDFENEFYKYGTQITVEASPNSGYKFVKWNDGKKYNPYKFSLLDDKYLLAIFMADEEEPDTMTVQPTTTTATFTWTFVDGGAIYYLTIYLDAACTIPLCTIQFNENGQLMSITFANHAPRRTKAQEEGFTYTVAGLNAGTEYFYKMEAKDEKGRLLNTDEGSFQTIKDATSLDHIAEDSLPVIKLLRNGQILILRGDKIYTMTGQEVK